MDSTNEYKGMTERDILVLLYENVKDMSRKNEVTEQRLKGLEMDLLEFKTKINTRIAVIGTVTTALGSVLSLLFQYFFK